jgi:aryl-alcohol dehydrogenase-like predicted oxidoreductase
MWRCYSVSFKLHRLKENIGAAAIELTPDDLREIDSAASKIAGL